MKRIITALKKKIYLIIGRAILTAIDNAEGTQKIQVKGLSGETITGVERFEEYGFTTIPLTNSEAEAVIGFINGNRDLGIVLCVHDRSKRPTDLSSGDVCMYHHSDRDSTYRLQFKNAGVAELTTPKAVNINVTDSSFGEINLVSAKNINAEATTLIDINCTIDVNIGDTGGTLQKLLTKIAMDTYNSHTHNETGGITNVPNQQMVEDTDTTIITKAN